MSINWNLINFLPPFSTLFCCFLILERFRFFTKIRFFFFFYCYDLSTCDYMNIFDMPTHTHNPSLSLSFLLDIICITKSFSLQNLSWKLFFSPIVQRAGAHISSCKELYNNFHYFFPPAPSLLFVVITAIYEQHKSIKFPFSLVL